MNDLRSFLDRIRSERKSDLIEVDREVNPRHETTAILTKLEEWRALVGDLAAARC